MLPSLGRLSLRQCVPVGVNFADAQEAQCEICNSAMHAPLSSGMTDPRLGLAEFKEDDEEVRRWSWNTAVLVCGHRFHRRCLAAYNWGGQNTQGQRRCPAFGAHGGGLGPQLSPADNADLNTDIAAQLNEQTPLNEAEQARYDLANATMQGGASVVDPTAAIAQAQAAQAEAIAANARYRDVQQKLEDAKKDYEALKAQATRLAQQPPSVTRQSSAKTLELRDEIVTLQELLRQQKLELNELKGENTVLELRDTEYNRQRDRQIMETERLRQQYTLELDNVAQLEAEQRRLEKSLETLKQELRADEPDLARAADLEAERDELQRALDAARDNLQKFRKSAKNQAAEYVARTSEEKAKTSEELEELRAKVEALKLQLQPAPKPEPEPEPEPAPEPAPEPVPEPAPGEADMSERRRNAMESDSDEDESESERSTPPSSSPSPPPQEEREEAQRPMTAAEKARERKQRAKVNNAPARQKAREEREKAAAEYKKRELAEAKASAERQKEADRKRAKDKKRAKAEAQAEQVRAEKEFKAKQKQPQQKPQDDATLHPAALFPMVSTAREEFMPLFLELTRINSQMKSGLDVLIKNAAMVLRVTPDWPFESIRKRVTDIVNAVPTLISILAKTDLSENAIMTWFGTRMDDYRQVHKTTATTAFDLGSMEKAMREAPNTPSSPHFAVLLSLMKKFQAQLLDMQNGIWRLLQLYIREEGMQLLLAEWDIQEVSVPDSTATMTQRQKGQQIAEYLETVKQGLQEDMRALASRGGDARKGGLDRLDRERKTFLQRFGADLLPAWQSQFSNLYEAIEEEQRALAAWMTFKEMEVPDAAAELEKFLQKLDALLSLLADRTRAGLQNPIECAQILTEARDVAQRKFPTRLSKIDTEFAWMRWPLIVGITTKLPSHKDASTLFYRMMALKDQIDEGFEDLFNMVRRIDDASPVALLEQQSFQDLGTFMHKIVHGTPNTIAFLLQTGPSEDAIEERFVKSVPDLVETKRACHRAANNLRTLGQTLADHLMAHVETLDEDEQALLKAAAGATASLAAGIVTIGDDYLELLERYIPDKKARFTVIAGQKPYPEWREWP